MRYLKNKIIGAVIAIAVSLVGGAFAIPGTTSATPSDIAGQQGRVVGVMDGDTVEVLMAGNQSLRCRLYGIDAPEKAQAYGQKSKQSLSDLIYGKTVSIEVRDKDRYGRSVCRILINGMDVNQEQVARGMAWWYQRYASGEHGYRDAEQQARSSRRGLWADPSPEEPWNWRRK